MKLLNIKQEKEYFMFILNSNSSLLNSLTSVFVTLTWHWIERLSDRSRDIKLGYLHKIQLLDICYVIKS